MLQTLRPLFIATLAVAGSALASAALAASTSAAAQPAGPLDSSGLLRLSLSLFAIVAIIVLAGFGLRRLRRATGVGEGPLRVVAALPLGTRERVVLLQVGERQVLLGQGPGRIEPLWVLDEPLSPARPAPKSGSGDSFAARIRALTGAGGEA